MSTPAIPAPETPYSPPWDEAFGAELMLCELPETGIPEDHIVATAIHMLISSYPDRFLNPEAFALVPELPDGSLAMAGHILASRQQPSPYPQNPRFGRQHTAGE